MLTAFPSPCANTANGTTCLVGLKTSSGGKLGSCRYHGRNSRLLRPAFLAQIGEDGQGTAETWVKTIGALYRLMRQGQDVRNRGRERLFTRYRHLKAEAKQEASATHRTECKLPTPTASSRFHGMVCGSNRVWNRHKATSKVTGLVSARQEAVKCAGSKEATLFAERTYGSTCEAGGMEGQAGNGLLVISQVPPGSFIPPMEGTPHKLPNRPKEPKCELLRRNSPTVTNKEKNERRTQTFH